MLFIYIYIKLNCHLIIIFTYTDCAEHLYIFFLSDSNTVAANCRQHCVDDDAAADEDPCAVCPFFASQQDLERALVVLSSCTWDACDADSRAKLFEARIELTEMAGFAEIAAAVKLTSAQEGRAPAATDGPDELDSYEALVRDAGKLSNYSNNTIMSNSASHCSWYNGNTNNIFHLNYS